MEHLFPLMVLPYLTLTLTLTPPRCPLVFHAQPCNRALFLSISSPPSFPVAKISILGNSNDIVDELAKEVPLASLPAHVGGPYQAFNPPLAFETHVGGALHCPAAVAPTPAEVRSYPLLSHPPVTREHMHDMYDM